MLGRGQRWGRLLHLSRRSASDAEADGGTDVDAHPTTDYDYGYAHEGTCIANSTGGCCEEHTPSDQSSNAIAGSVGASGGRRGGGRGGMVGLDPWRWRSRTVRFFGRHHQVGVPFPIRGVAGLSDHQQPTRSSAVAPRHDHDHDHDHHPNRRLPHPPPAQVAAAQHPHRHCQSRRRVGRHHRQQDGSPQHRIQRVGSGCCPPERAVVRRWADHRHVRRRGQRWVRCGRRGGSHGKAGEAGHPAGGAGGCAGARSASIRRR